MTPGRRFNIDDLLRPTFDRRLRRLPRLIGRAVAVVRRAAPALLARSAILQLVAGAGLGGQLLIGRNLLGEVLAQSGPGRFSAMAPNVAILVAVTALVALADLARGEEQRVLTEHVGRHAADQVLDVSSAVELIAFEHPQFADRLQRALVNAQLRPVQVVNGLLSVLGGLFAAAGIAAALLVLQPLFFVLVLVAYVPALFAANRASRLLHDFAVSQTERDRRRNYLFTLLGRREEAAEVRSFGLASSLRARHDRLYDERIGALRGVVRRRLALGAAGQLLTSVLTAGAIGVLVWQVADGRVTPATGAAAAGAMVLLGARFSSLASGVRQLYEASLFLEDFTGFVDALASVTEPRSDLVSAPTGFSSLVVDRVTFRYPSRDQPSLRDVSIEIQSGEVVALVGENGSGKTTLAKLLAGLYSADEGTISWDGADITTFDPNELRESVAVIFQDFVKFQLSVGENIALGRPDRGDDLEQLRAAATGAGADEFLSALADGYDTRLGPQYLGGTDLSIGQWQRVALARALYRDAQFVILDEPTASLDPRAERALFEGIRSVFADKTVLVISHRFANVRTADRIYVLADGHVVEQGTHDELMARRGRYAELFTMQAGAYLDPPES